MRRVAIVLSALIFALFANGQALAADKTTDAKKAAAIEERKARAEEARLQKQEEHQSSSPAPRFRAPKTRDYSSWLYEKPRKSSENLSFRQ